MSQTFDVVQAWIANVACSHSESKSTAQKYRLSINEFCQFARACPSDIMAEYEKSEERVFKRKYGLLVKAWISHMSKGTQAPKNTSC